MIKLKNNFNHGDEKRMNNLFNYKNVTKMNAVLIILLLTSIASSLWTSFEVNKSNEKRLISLGLAQELQQSSNNLTLNARLYVVTGEKKWEDEYNNIVAWRSGTAPRPDGRTIPFMELLKEAGFSQEEFAELEKANKLSTDLIATEVEAMNAVKGLFKDESGQYNRKSDPNFELARNLMHNKKYTDFIVTIGQPIGVFNELLKNRLNSEVEKFSSRIKMLQTLTFVIAILIFSLSTYSSFALKKVLAGAISNLTLSSNKIKDVMNGLQSAGESLSSLSTEGAASVSETVAAVDETNSMITNNKELALETSQTTHKSKANANRGKEVVHHMSELMQEINKVNDDVAMTVENGNKRFGEVINMINEISNKTQVINDIVFQTRLLSFNASVEAARAGDHGKGFAVVAEEIGSLATLSGKSATEITTILEESVRNVKTIVDETRSTVDSIVKIAKSKSNEGQEIARECSIVLEDIVSEVGKVVTMSDQITSASTEQANGMNEIAKAMENIDQSAHETSHLSKKVSQISEELKHEIHSISEMISEIQQLTA